MSQYNEVFALDCDIVRLHRYGTVGLCHTNVVVSYSALTCVAKRCRQLRGDIVWIYFLWLYCGIHKKSSHTRKSNAKVEAHCIVRRRQSIVSMVQREARQHVCSDCKEIALHEGYLANCSASTPSKLRHKSHAISIYPAHLRVLELSVKNGKCKS